METGVNTACPLVMHIDLNSCFTTIEQQANPLIRYKPVVVAAYTTPGGFILAASYEAKRMGIKLGLIVREGRAIEPNLIVLAPDPPKYREAYKRFKKLLLDYTSDVEPKSIDEFVINFAGSPVITAGRDLQDIGYEIKQRIRESIGEYVSVNVGIGPNRFLAKTAAGLDKPDGLNVVTAANIMAMYSRLDLLDLTGINRGYKARLNSVGIMTPLQFYEASADFLARRVFRSRVGFDWYLRLRGWEVDNVQRRRKSFGHQYALSRKTSDRQELSKLLVKLCEKTGRRLRANDYSAQGIHLSLRFEDRTHWGKGVKHVRAFFTTQDVFSHARELLHQAPTTSRVTSMSVTAYSLMDKNAEQLGLFDGHASTDKRSVSRAMDNINDRYGDFTVFPAIMAGMDDTIIDRIAFGNVSEII